MITLVERCSHSIKYFCFHEGFRQYTVNEKAYIVGDVFLSIARDEDYREFGVDSERTPDEVGARQNGHGEVGNRECNFPTILYIVLQGLAGSLKDTCRHSWRSTMSPIMSSSSTTRMTSLSSQSVSIMEEAYRSLRRIENDQGLAADDFFGDPLEIRWNVPIIFFRWPVEGRDRSCPRIEPPP
jgi:hypothetical protein